MTGLWNQAIFSHRRSWLHGFRFVLAGSTKKVASADNKTRIRSRACGSGDISDSAGLMCADGYGIRSHRLDLQGFRRPNRAPFQRWMSGFIAPFEADSTELCERHGPTPKRKYFSPGAVVVFSLLR